MGKRWRRLVRFVQRPRGEKVLLLEAVALLGAWRLVQVFVPFPRLASRLGHLHAECLREISPTQRQLGSRVGWAVNAAAHHVPWRSDCLPRALAARNMLVRRGLPVTLYLGTARDDPERLIAHAWVRCGDTVLTGGPSHRRYTVVATFAEWPDSPDVP